MAQVKRFTALLKQLAIGKYLRIELPLVVGQDLAGDVLGIRWEPVTEAFSIKVNGRSGITDRVVRLSDVTARMFYIGLDCEGVKVFPNVCPEWLQGGSL